VAVKDEHSPPVTPETLTVALLRTARNLHTEAADSHWPYFLEIRSKPPLEPAQPILVFRPATAARTWTRRRFVQTTSTKKRAFRRSSVEQAGRKAFVMVISFLVFNAK